MEWYRDAFWSLSSDRPVGMGVGAIPWSSIDAYAKRHDVSDFEAFEAVIRAADSAYLEHAHAKQQQRKPHGG